MLFQRFYSHSQETMGYIFVKYLFMADLEPKLQLSESADAVLQRIEDYW